MQWLLANMWIALAVAAGFGLLLGYALRGFASANRIRRAQVERDLARTELEQSRAEVDALYAAQRKRQESMASSGAHEDLQKELAAREVRITELGDQLAAARSELETLSQKSANGNGIAETATAAVAGAVAGAALSSEDETKLRELQDRNVWLEERVAHLEQAVESKPEAGTSAVVSEAVASGTSSEKLEWQNQYLRQRVDALETRLSAAAPAAAVMASEENELAEASEPSAGDENQDEELARLRWRNRYLEGRLAYYEEGDGQAEAAGEEPAEDAPIEVEELASEPSSEVEVEAEAPVELTEDTPEAPVEMPVTEEGEVHPSEAMLAELNQANDSGEAVIPVQPLQIDKPAGGGDDLTAIGGIGPRIAEVLNGLGVWTYVQVAEWTPEHAAWIEEHLSFKGRVGREQWVEQARSLLEPAEA